MTDKNTLQKSFEELIRQEKSTIYSVCLMYADNSDEADDMAQEALVNLWRGFEKFRGDSSPRTWVYRVTLNTCLSFQRKNRRNKHDRIDIDPEILSEDSAIGRQSQMLHERIKKLGPFDRAIILMWLEDMPYEEIGAIAGISPKAVGMRLVRIRQQLKNQEAES